MTYHANDLQCPTNSTQDFSQFSLRKLRFYNPGQNTLEKVKNLVKTRKH